MEAAVRQGGFGIDPMREEGIPQGAAQSGSGENEGGMPGGQGGSDEAGYRGG
jgi:hypothetical protein